MSLEDLTGSSKYISDLVETNPDGATDPKSQGDDHIRGIKNTLKNTFPNITGAVTATQAELNVLDGITATTAELNILDGVTKTAAEINALYSAGGTDVAVADGGTGASTAAGARTNLGLGALSTLGSISNGYLDAGAVTYDKLNSALYTVGAIGTYALLYDTATTSRSPGDTVAGSTLQYADANGPGVAGTSPSGTWRCMGASDAASSNVTLWLRIS